MENLPRAVKENRILHTLLEDLGERCLHVDYNELANHPKCVETRCKDYIRRYGIDLSANCFGRNSIKKVVPVDYKDHLVQTFRKEILELL